MPAPARIRFVPDSLPAVDRCGEYPLSNAVAAFSYRCPTHCIHFYGYAGVLSIGGERFPFSPGDLSCAPAGAELVFESGSPGRHLVVHFRDPVPARMRGVPRVELPPVVRMGAERLRVREEMRGICELFNAKARGAAKASLVSEANLRLKALLLFLARLAGKKAGPAACAPVRAGNFVWEEFASLLEGSLGRPLSLAWLADRLGVAPSTLSRKFRAAAGCSVMQFVLRQRMERAKVMLCSTTMSVASVGKAVGFPDPQHFNKTFRRRTGASPSAFREKNKPGFIAPPERNRSVWGRWRKKGWL